MIRAALIALLLVAGCSDPYLGAGVGIGPNGVRVSPVLSGNLGGARVSVSP